MITGELKNKIDSLWDIFAAGGLVNPLDVIEQITYLMFIHDLDDSDNLRAKEAAMLGLPYTSIFTDEVQVGERTIDGQQLKWSVFHDFPAGKMYSVVQEWVFPFIKNLHGDKNSAYSKYMDDAIFKLPTPLLLSKVVDALDEIYLLMSQSQAVDVRGDTYEYLLSKISQSGLNGQFRTPRHIIRMMVELMDPKADDVICDPACGTAGFLVASAEYIRSHYLGRRTADCVGFIKGYCWYDPETDSVNYATNGMPDIGADQMYRTATEKGPISTMPEIPGLAVWHQGHIGIYIGNGYAIEAMGTRYGVVKTRVAARSWTHWLKIPYINYIEETEEDT